ncbi:peptidylprolyl isomerase [Luteimonas sp. MC1825]|uniref:FKBP-type peptidyl-prolyl cis-trans isomerase n=1 Tax=Luteimonas sp. MC1825 TaxID=2761107 RepID=UPI001614CF57|nr:peptidylprolyl isomerase [Luteimonas sp. MC1825]MBB6598550.1 peptidylprolyl isomerase [Luteimonas sp. MC1825]QOC88732.1 peptidylprolyl isomerase [Luteimonas sp. MC1825]
MDIADRRIATVHFTLTDAASGQAITSTRGHEPLTYMHGSGGIARGLEQALEGRKAGDRFEVVVAPEDGFGQRHDALVQTLPRAMWRAPSEPTVGDKLETTTASGPLEVVVTAVSADGITVDGNHPLAGRAFRAEVEVLSVRVPTPDEVQFGLG